MSQTETPEVIQGRIGWTAGDYGKADPEELEPHPKNEEIYGDTEEPSQLGEEFIESVREKGVMEPLIITEGKRIISGHRRQLAAIETDQEKVPIIKYDFDNELDEREALIELNRQREKSDWQKLREAEELLEIKRQKGRARMSEGGKADKEGSFGRKNLDNHDSWKEVADTVGASEAGLSRGFEVKDKAESETTPEPVQEVAQQELEKLKTGDSTFYTAKKQVEQAEREYKERREREELDENRISEFNQSQEKYEVLHGDFADADIEPESVDHILTDPPYGEDGLEAWEKLSEFADHVLKPGGFCIAYSGKYHLPAVMDRMGEHLEYYWQAVVVHAGPGAKFFARNLRTGYKPILIYAKPPVEAQEEWVTDVIKGGGREKDDHDWQQAEAEAADLLERFTAINHRICDPMAGSGTTLVACQRTDRRCVAIDRDPDAIESIQRRVTDES